MRLAYLYSRYPVLSQTFCDTEMLALERRGFSLVIGSIHPPQTTIRHPHAAQLRAPIYYAPPQPILQLWKEKIRAQNRWPDALIAAHEQKYGAGVKARTRARNASYYAELFARNRVDHLHVHFANRAAHTALFLKAMTNIPFSITAHGQDFMTDLGNDDLLREICDAAEFVAVETDYSRGLMQQRCPGAAEKIHRVYNGMDLQNFSAVGPSTRNAPLRILSVGRLVEFKGFEFLIEACGELRRGGIEFTCEIVGEGPLRENLEKQIAHLRLNNVVQLSGPASQGQVLEKLRACDVFVLASVIDAAGASDVFPTVILEAMASARPVVSTRLAGIPESVIDGETGLLVQPKESTALAEALEMLCGDPELRQRFGAAGRNRVEQNFRVETTVAPLIALLEEATPSPPSSSPAIAKPKIAYLTDHWPDDQLATLETELAEMRRRNLPIVPFVCRLNSEKRLTSAMKRLATRLEFLPDETVLEAEWQANRAIAPELEVETADSEPARCAIFLGKMIRERGISHVHATSSRSLLCAIMLKKMIGTTVSATIEARPKEPPEVLRNALAQCAGGRMADRKIADELGASFLFDKSISGKFWVTLTRIPAIDLTGQTKLWEEWSKLLASWSENKTHHFGT